VGGCGGGGQGLKTQSFLCGGGWFVFGGVGGGVWAAGWGGGGGGFVGLGGVRVVFWWGGFGGWGGGGFWGLGGFLGSVPPPLFPTLCHDRAGTVIAYDPHPCIGPLNLQSNLREHNTRRLP